MSHTVLITGGAGFIGSHVARDLLDRGHHVRVLDNLTPQVHDQGTRPHYLEQDVELVQGDVRDPEAVSRALQRVDRVVHLAARVGVGQSMYEIAEYAGANTYGTGVLLNALMDKPVERLVVASSMSIYGEGLYRSDRGDVFSDIDRSADQLARKEWEPKGPQGEGLEPIPTSETKTPSLSSIYALTK